MLHKCISGSQTGADLGALKAAKKCGITTGGWIPKGCLTEAGPKPELLEMYGLTEHTSASYPGRTYANCRDSCGTIRFAANFSSAGEKCTLKAIKQYNKPHLDVDIFDPPTPKEVAEWILSNNIQNLNCAGNRESSSPGIGQFVENFLIEVFTELGYPPSPQNQSN